MLRHARLFALRKTEASRQSPLHDPAEENSRDGHPCPPMTAFLSATVDRRVKSDRLRRADSALTRVALGRAGVQPIAVVALRVWSTLHRPQRTPRESRFEAVFREAPLPPGRRIRARLQNDSHAGHQQARSFPIESIGVRSRIMPPLPRQFALFAIAPPDR